MQIAILGSGEVGRFLARGWTAAGHHLPQVRLVKMFNTMAQKVMVDPAALPQESTVFVAGDDEAARATATALARELGWTDVLDLGALSAARGLEMYLPLWLSILNAVGGPAFNIKVVR